VGRIGDETLLAADRALQSIEIGSVTSSSLMPTISKRDCPSTVIRQSSGESRACNLNGS